MSKIHSYKKFVMVNESRSYEVSLEEAKNFLKTKATEWDIKSNQIFRGVKDSKDKKYSIINPSKYNRTSLMKKDNIYNVVIDNIPSWSDYPNRHQSIFGHLYNPSNPNPDNTHNLYGYVNYVIPKDNAKIAICPKSDVRYMDVGNTFIENISIMGTPDIFSVINKIFYNGGLSISKWKYILKIMNEVTLKEIQNIGDSHSIGRIIEDDNHRVIIEKLNNVMKKEGYSSLWDLFNVGFSPENQDMELVNYTKENINNLKIKTSEEREIWTDGECLIVNPNFIDELWKN